MDQAFCEGYGVAKGHIHDSIQSPDAADAVMVLKFTVDCTFTIKTSRLNLRRSAYIHMFKNDNNLEDLNAPPPESCGKRRWQNITTGNPRRRRPNKAFSLTVD
nr:uncharacterized protein CTRU02_02198 [Colletotrichum truncatum]KAF6799327.1 hypothetical protein CTRU02_02198 [Colletotrichum truncatum]